MPEQQESESTMQMNPVPDGSRKCLEHLKTYPIVNTTRNWLYYIPFAQQTKQVLTPTIRIVRNTQPLKIVFDYGDVAADEALTRLDNICAAIQNVEPMNIYASVARPVKGCIDTVDKSVKATDEKIRKQMIEPTMKTMNNVIDSISKPIIHEVKSTVVDSKDSKTPIKKTLDAFNELQSAPERKSLKQSVSAAISSISAKSKIDVA